MSRPRARVPTLMSSPDRDDNQQAPGDEAPPGTPDTGEDVCPRCAGDGRIDGQDCPVCGGTGRVVTGVGGG